MARTRPGPGRCRVCPGDLGLKPQMARTFAVGGTCRSAKSMGILLDRSLKPAVYQPSSYLIPTLILPSTNPNPTFQTSLMHTLLLPYSSSEWVYLGSYRCALKLRGHRAERFASTRYFCMAVACLPVSNPNFATCRLELLAKFASAESDKLPLSLLFLPTFEIFVCC